MTGQFQNGTANLKLENVGQGKDLQARFLAVWQGKELRDFALRAGKWGDAMRQTEGVALTKEYNIT